MSAVILEPVCPGHSHSARCPTTCPSWGSDAGGLHECASCDDPVEERSVGFKAESRFFPFGPRRPTCFQNVRSFVPDKETAWELTRCQVHARPSGSPHNLDEEKLPRRCDTVETRSVSHVLRFGKRTVSVDVMGAYFDLSDVALSKWSALQPE